MKKVLPEQKGLWYIEYFRPDDSSQIFAAICEYKYTTYEEEFKDFQDAAHHYNIIKLLYDTEWASRTLNIYVNYPTKDSSENEKEWGWYYIKKLKGDIDDNPEYFI